LVNMHGQRFDIFRAGIHTLLEVPRVLRKAESVMLRVTAEARGGACADIYFQALNISGSWVEQREGLERSGPLLYLAGASSRTAASSTSWIRVGPVLDLKVVWGHTSGGIEYLNLFARHLSQVTLPIGGLLGADDHTYASTPGPTCKHRVALLSFLDSGQGRSRVKLAPDPVSLGRDGR